jgi:hypothetical protein
VYQFIVDYHAMGYTPLNVSHQLMLHPLRHDEQPRYVTSAYPFYAVSLVMACAVVVVSIVFALQAPIFSDRLGAGKKGESAPATTAPLPSASPDAMRRTSSSPSDPARRKSA